MILKKNPNLAKKDYFSNKEKNEIKTKIIIQIIVKIEISQKSQ